VSALPLHVVPVSYTVSGFRAYVVSRIRTCFDTFVVNVCRNNSRSCDPRTVRQDSCITRVHIARSSNENAIAFVRRRRRHTRSSGEERRHSERLFRKRVRPSDRVARTFRTPYVTARANASSRRVRNRVVFSQPSSVSGLLSCHLRERERELIDCRCLPVSALSLHVVSVRDTVSGHHANSVSYWYFRSRRLPEQLAFLRPANRSAGFLYHASGVHIARSSDENTSRRYVCDCDRTTKLLLLLLLLYNEQ